MLSPPKTGDVQKMSGAFLALIFLAIFLLLTIIVNINRGLINKIYRAFLNENFSALLFRETKHSALNYLYTLAYVVFFINAGMFLYLSQFAGGWNFGGPYTLIYFIAGALFVYLTRHLVMRILARIFPVTKEVNHYNFNIIVFNIIVGLFLIPINLFLAFGPEVLFTPLLYGTLFILIGLYIFRQLRGTLIVSHLILQNIFLFFVYLCAVEILPLAVLLKALA